MIELASGCITHQKTGAIVNAANGSLLAGGGVCGAIHRAAGPRLEEACLAIAANLPQETLGDGCAVMTPGFELHRPVIHAVGPIYTQRDPRTAGRLLADCYIGAIGIAHAAGLTSIAFPAISTGIYGYPIDEAARVAVGACRSIDRPHFLIRFVLRDHAALSVYRNVTGLP